MTGVGGWVGSGMAEAMPFRDRSFGGVAMPFWDRSFGDVLEGDEGGGCDLGEGEIFCGAAGTLFPVEEELAVAVGDAGGGVDVELGEGSVDPVGGAFELGPG